jgi:hypothetical protein
METEKKDKEETGHGRNQSTLCKEKTGQQTTARNTRSQKTEDAGDNRG